MSTVERVRILDYLPPEEKQKVLTLVTRLREETEAKEKYLGLYQQAQREIEQLTRTCSLLKDQNKQLKQQIHNSFSMVSQLRAQFHSNHQKRAQLPARSDNDWEDLSEQADLENKPQESNSIMVLNCPPKNKPKSQIMKYRPPVVTDKKAIPQLNISSSELCQTQLSNSRSQEIMDLRQQVRALQQEKRKKKEKEEEMTEKMKLIEQIKNRYRQGSERSHDSSAVKEKSTQKIDITDTFQQQQARTEHSNDKSEHRSAEKPKKEIVAHSLGQKKENKKTTNPQVFQGKQIKETKTSKTPGSGYIITVDDYSDVLDMINDYN